MRRRFRLWYALPALLGALAFAPAALAAGAGVEIDSVPGQIYDVDSGRILFSQSAGAFGVKDRATGQVTSLSTPPYHAPTGGFLTSHGALLVSATGLDAQLQEWRDGSMVPLGTIYVGTSLRVAGDYAEWSNEGVLTRRNLATGVNEQVSSNAAANLNDVAANGDVAYWTNDYVVARYRSGSSTTLATGSNEHPQDSPLTDGTNVVWRETSPHCCGAPGFGALHAYGSSAPLALSNTERNYPPVPGEDYRVAGGWIAFTRGDAGQTEVWLRDPAGNETQVSGAGANRLAALAPNGELIYVTTAFGSDGFLLYRPGQGSAPVAQTQAGEGPEGERGYGDHAFFLAGHWYGVFGGSLRRLSPDATAQGARTEITTAPGPEDTASQASVSFLSNEGDTAFQCKLDGGAYEPCESPVTYTSLQRGRHTAAVRAVIDQDHVETDPAVTAWSVEAQPPAVTIDSAPTGRSSDTTPAIAGAAGNDAEDAAEVTLKIYAGAKATGTPVRTIHTTRTGGTWSAQVQSPLADGEYTAEAQQSDAAGNVGRSQPRTFVIDATRPSAVLDVSPLPVLTGQAVEFDASRSADADGGSIVRYQWDLDGDGDFERDTGATSSTSRTYQMPHELHPAVRVTDSAGNRSVDRIDMTVAPKPPPGFPGVTINDGERFTNTPDVFVSPVWPPGDTDVILSNDGGFRDAVTAPLADNVPWRLDSSGPERLPKTIYARFSPNGTTYQDDIILDETPPAVVVAEITGVGPGLSAASTSKRTYHLHVRARDRTAGVSRMQITTNRGRPGHGRRYRSHVKFVAASSKIFVRVRDRAGNWSRWKRCTQ
jgi:hypothetical protein